MNERTRFASLFEFLDRIATFNFTLSFELSIMKISNE